MAATHRSQNGPWAEARHVIEVLDLCSRGNEMQDSFKALGARTAIWDCFSGFQS